MIIKDGVVFKASVVGGPQEAEIAVNEESIHRYYAGESDEPSQIIEKEKNEKRILEEW
ncbi:MAG: hypothetical protein AAB689_01880 [Patescibacteria group bacterium]